MDKKTILVFSIDAGGTEAVAALIKKEIDHFSWKIITSKNKPGFSIFEKNHLVGQSALNFNFVEEEWDFAHILEDCTLFLATTSWDFNLKELFCICKRKQVPSIVILDHWIDFRERFGYPDKDWENNLPDFIALMDEEAYKIAAQLKLPNLVRVNNYYLADIKEQYKKLTPINEESTDLLIVSQTIPFKKNTFNYIGSIEYNLLHFVKRHFEKLAIRYKINKIQIRLHPSQDKAVMTEYLAILDGIPVEIHSANEISLIEQISAARLVIGLNSMALLIAWVLEKPIISYTTGRFKLTLPLPPALCIRHLKHLLNPKFKDFSSLQRTAAFQYYDNHPFYKLLGQINLN